MNTKNNNKQKCKNIKLVLTDVDGVLTDGGRHYSEKGEILKKFHVRDGMGVNILLRNNIKTIILTKEKSKIVRKWAKEMNISQVYGGIIKKELLLTEICKKYGVKMIFSSFARTKYELRSDEFFKVFSNILGKF